MRALGCGVEPRLERCSDLVSIKADGIIPCSATSNATRQTTSVTKMNSDHSVRLAGHDPERAQHCSALLIDEFDHRHVMLAAFHTATFGSVAYELSELNSD